MHVPQKQIPIAPAQTSVAQVLITRVTRLIMGLIYTESPDRFFTTTQETRISVIINSFGYCRRNDQRDAAE